MLKSVQYRKQKGKAPLIIRLDKREIPSLKETLLDELRSVKRDKNRLTGSTLKFVEGSALFELPKLESNIFDGVITSPPYCNRYDYTRTYALELSYLNATDNHIKKLRQELLSCTVENKPKLNRLKEHYVSLGKSADYNKILSIVG